MTLTIEKVQQDLIAKAGISNFGRLSEFGVSDFFYSSFVFKNLTEKTPIFELSSSGVLKPSVKEFLKQFTDLTETNIVFESHDYDSQVFSLTSDKLNCFLHVSSSEERFIINFYCNNYDQFLTVKAFITSHLQNKRNNENIYAISRTPKGGLDLMSLGKLEYTLEKENYEPDVVKEYEYILDEYSSPDPKGRLVILNGKPGVGKSHLVRGILSKMKNALVIILPSRLTGEIDGPELMQLIIGT
jgi:hypothetical protein